MPKDARTLYLLSWRRAGWASGRTTVKPFLTKNAAFSYAYKLLHATSAFDKSLVEDLKVQPVAGIIGGPSELPDKLLDAINAQGTRAPKAVTPKTLAEKLGVVLEPCPENCGTAFCLDKEHWGLDGSESLDDDGSYE